ncbi:MAG: DNA-packaging protein [Planctomycetes bacterium]|nr:DNA-packaging protein [Planctomycetota bacterium]
MQTATVTIPRPHEKQRLFIEHPAKRKIVRAGRRGGKTVGMAIMAAEMFLKEKRVLYAAPTQDQIDRFWTEITKAFSEPIRAGAYYKNETRHIIEVRGTENRVRAKTAWNADTLRGDYADVLILDEYQLMDETAWSEVGAPMLLDNNGDAIFIYTPPSLHSRSTTKARDPRHAAKLWIKADEDESGRWAAFHFTSHDNPHISAEALADIKQDMTALAIRQEINAEDIDEAPGALWHRRAVMIGTQKVLGLEDNRVFKAPPLRRIAVGVDPSGSTTGDACGIVACGIDSSDEHYTLEDNSIQGSPDIWAREACRTYHKLKADVMVAEANYGGEMVAKVIKDTDSSINVKLVHATRGKAVRAEPISAKTERGEDHMVGNFPALEDELCLWMPGDKSPNRLDAKVWADTELAGGMNPADMIAFV